MGAVNIKRVAALTRMGRMRPPGVQGFSDTGNRSEIYATNNEKAQSLVCTNDVPREQGAWEFLRPNTLVSAHRKLVGNQRRRRDAAETPRAAHQDSEQGKTIRELRRAPGGKNSAARAERLPIEYQIADFRLKISDCERS
jgi:hypothetical protein